MNYLDDYAEDSTIYIYFTTHDKDTGAPVAPSSAFEAADVAIYKNGSATQKATTNGLTMTSPFDSITGLHLLVIDTSNDTGDAGFWTTAAEFSVILNPDETVDSQVVLKVIATFSIERAGGKLALLKNATYGLSALETIVDDLESRLTAARAGYLDNLSAGAVATQASVNTIDDFIDTEVAAILAAVDTEIATLVSELAKVPKSDGAITWNGTALGSIQSEANDALVAYDPPTKAELDAAFTEIKGATWAAGTDTLEHIRDKETDIETDTQDIQTQVGVDGAGLTAIGDVRISNQIKKNTQLTAFPFLMTDSTNHLPMAGLGAGVTPTRSIDGAGFAGCANAVAEISNGWYKITLAAADLNGDTIALRFTAAGADDLNITIVTQAQA